MRDIDLNVYVRSEGPLAEADAWGDDENEYYNDRPDARPPSPQTASKAPLAEYAVPPSNLPVSYSTLIVTDFYHQNHLFVNNLMIQERYMTKKNLIKLFLLHIFFSDELSLTGNL